MECLEDRYYYNQPLPYKVSDYLFVSDCLFMKCYVCLFHIDPVPISGCALTCIITIVIGKCFIIYIIICETTLLQYYNYYYNVLVVIIVIIAMLLVVVTVAVVVKRHLSNTGTCWC